MMHSRHIFLYDSCGDTLAILSLLIHSLCYFDAFQCGVLLDPLREVLEFATVGFYYHFAFLDGEFMKLGADYILAFFIDLNDRNVDV